MTFLITLVLAAEIAGGNPVSTASIEQAVTEYDKKANSIKIGDSKDSVLAILLPIENMLAIDERVAPDIEIIGSVRIEIHFARSGVQPNKVRMCDELTPYIFHNDKLTFIGWQSFGAQGYGPCAINRKSIFYQSFRDQCAKEVTREGRVSTLLRHWCTAEDRRGR